MTATPAMQIQSLTMKVRPGNAGLVRINTFDTSGNPLDVHTGFTLAAFKCLSASNANPLTAAVDISGDFTAAFDTTGVTLSYTAAQATTIAGALLGLNNNCSVELSEDGGTTKFDVAVGTIGVDNISGLRNS